MGAVGKGWGFGYGLKGRGGLTSGRELRICLGYWLVGL